MRNTDAESMELTEIELEAVAGGLAKGKDRPVPSTQTTSGVVYTTSEAGGITTARQSLAVKAATATPQQSGCVGGVCRKR